MSKVIMTVDDSPSVRSIIRKSLSNAGFTVLGAGDGKQALTNLRGMNVDMIITDLNMPEMNGIEFIGSLRKLPKYKFIPVLMLTSESQPELKQQGKQAGASGWLCKPFQPDQLLAVVKRLLP